MEAQESFSYTGQQIYGEHYLFYLDFLEARLGEKGFGRVDGMES